MGFTVLFIAMVLMVTIVVIPVFRDRKAMKIVEATGPLLAYNEVNGVLAICRHSQLEEAVKEWGRKIDEEKDENKKLKLCLSKIRVEVDPTFTFANDSNQISLHTGSRGIVDELKADLVELVTGYSLSQLDYDFHFVSELFVQDDRLVVPFIKMSSDEEARRQIKTHGHHTIEEARKVLVSR